MKHSLFTASVVLAACLVMYANTAGRERSTITDNEAWLKQLHGQLILAWQHADAKAMASVYAEDADLVIPTGLTMRGKQEIEHFYANVFDAGYRGSQGASEIVRIRFLRPDIAVVDATWSIKNVHDRQGSPAADEAGVLTFVAVRSSGAWQIAVVREQTSATAFRAANGH